MNRYTIYCTEEQTRKALKLGAPIKHKEVTDFEGHLLDYNITEIPTAEEMIGWIEEQENINDIETYKFDADWKFEIFLTDGNYIKSAKFPTRKEATLAAIDAALEYLSNNKKKK